MFETDERSVLAAGARYLLHSSLLIRDADLSVGTPCEDWDLGHLLRHIDTSLEQFTGMLAVPALIADANTDSRPRPGTDYVAALRDGIVDLLLAATSPPTADRWCEIWGRILPTEIVLYVATIEMVLHAWDIGQACRTNRPIPADLASVLMEVAPPLAKAGVAAHVFAHPVEVPTTAAPGDQLLALFGRRSGFRQAHDADL